VRDTGRLAPTFDDVEGELQWLAGDDIRLRGGSATRRRVTRCWLDAAGSPMERQRARAMARVSIFANQNLL
jgi:hypothetical protein